jgi:hypothetical protein
MTSIEKRGTKRKLHQARLCWATLDERAERVLTTVISGGQTGADIAALTAAKKIGFRTAGVSVLAIPDYNITQVPFESVRKHGSALIARSIANVESADGTVAFRTAASPGTDKTIGYCVTGKWKNVDTSRASQLQTEHQYKPLLVLRSAYRLSTFAAQQICDFVINNNIRVLNVCGHRNDERALMPNYSKLVEEIMSIALIKIKRAQKADKNRVTLPDLGFQ